MRRTSIVTILTVIAAGALYQTLFGDEPGSGRLLTPQPTSAIGSGEGAVAVSPDGALMRWLSIPEGVELPQLPIFTAPEKARLSGPLLEQARVLGAIPPALRPHVAGSYYGESGVDVELRSGIELRFGTATRLKEKWQAAATVFADPSVSALDYVDLHDPNHPSVGGSGHTLPPLP